MAAVPIPDADIRQGMCIHVLCSLEISKGGRQKLITRDCITVLKQMTRTYYSSFYSSKPNSAALSNRHTGGGPSSGWFHTSSCLGVAASPTGFRHSRELRVHLASTRRPTRALATQSRDQCVLDGAPELRRLHNSCARRSLGIHSRAPERRSKGKYVLTVCFAFLRHLNDGG